MTILIFTLMFFLGASFMILTLDLVNSYNVFVNYKTPLKLHRDKIIDGRNYYFEKRIGDYAYFRFLDSEYCLRLNLTNRRSALFIGENCTVPETVDINTCQTDIYNTVFERHRIPMIDDLYIVNNVYYSKNMFSSFTQEVQDKLREMERNSNVANSKIESKEEITNQILDKINKFGLSSLTKEEIEFLDNLNK